MGRVILGLSDRQFYALTPRQFHLLVDRHRERTKHQEWMTGILASTMANFSMSPPKEPLKPTDFMPSAKAKTKPRAPRIDRRKVADKVRAIFDERMKLQCQN